MARQSFNVKMWSVQMFSSLYNYSSKENMCTLTVAEEANEIRYEFLCVRCVLRYANNLLDTELNCLPKYERWTIAILDNVEGSTCNGCMDK